MAIFVKHAAAQYDALAKRLAVMLAGEVACFRVDNRRIKQRPSHFGERVGKVDQRLRRRALDRGDIEWMQMIWLRARVVPPVSRQICHCWKPPLLRIPAVRERA